MSPGGLSGLQNQREGFGASWVGSIPTYSRHINNIAEFNGKPENSAFYFSEHR